MIAEPHRDIRANPGRPAMVLLAVGYQQICKGGKVGGWLTKPVRTLALHNILIKLVSPHESEKVEEGNGLMNAADMKQQQQKQQQLSLRILMAENGDPPRLP